MLSLYVDLVKNKIRTCNPKNKNCPLVPKMWIKQVLTVLQSEGYDADGNIVSEEQAE